jgi:hypothetical protein
MDYPETPVRERFRKAFAEELALHPDKAPGPAALARRMGWRNTNDLPGRVTGLRRELLKEAGFVQKKDRNHLGGRWVKP